MTKSMRALAALPVLLAALAPAPAVAEEPGIGISVGGGLIGPPNGFSTNVQYVSSVNFRGEPVGSWSEASIGLLSRAQQLGLNKDKVFQTTGLTLGVGVKAWFLHLGVEGEAALLGSIVPTSATSVDFHNGGGFLAGPYVAATLPFLHTDFSALDVSFHYPIFNTVDPGIGPNLMLTLWLGVPPKLEGTDSDEGDEAKPDEKATPDAAPSPVEATPAPKPPAKPSAKPTKPGKKK